MATTSLGTDAVPGVLGEGRAAEALRAPEDGSAGRGAAIRVWVARAILLGAFVGLWELAVTVGFVSPAFVATPVSVGRALGRVLSSQGFGHNLAVTSLEVAVSFAAAAVAGVIGAILLDRLAAVRRVLAPYITAINSLPRIALGPLFILWFGIGSMSKIVLAFSLGFFIVLLGTLGGLANVDRDMLLMGRLYGANEAQLFFRVRLPWALPSVFTSLKLSLIYCMGGAIVGEMIAARAGLGQLIETYSGEFDIASLLAVLLVLVTIVMAITGAITAAEGHFLRWARGSTDVPGGRA